MASGGSPKPLVIGESGANPQPIVRVGSVVNGKGTVTVDPPAVYERERDRNFQITFEAAGPMYDVYDDGVLSIDSRITITIPSNLGQAGEERTPSVMLQPHKRHFGRGRVRYRITYIRHSGV